MDNKTHKAQTLGGIKWNIINQVLQQIVSVIIGIILARLLSPSEFGMIGMIAVFTGFLTVFKDFGLGSALIHKSDITEVDKSTVFWSNFIFGVFLFLLITLCSGLISSFYNSPELQLIIIVSSTSFIIQSVSYVQNTLIQKELAFKKLFGINLIGLLFSGTLGIWMAYNNYGVWSLVFKSLLEVTIGTIVIWLISDWTPKFVFNKKNLKELLNYSLPLMGSKSFQYWNRNSDNLLIGKFLGSDALGVYTKAYSLMLLPVKKISSMLSAVLFPSISLIKHDTLRITDIYLKSVRIISLITFPVMGLLFVVADQFVFLILGEQWKEAIPVIRILCFVGALQSIGTLNGNIFLGLGKTRLQFKLNVYLGIFIIIAISIGLLKGIKGVATAYMIATFISSFILRWYIGKLLMINIYTQIKPLLPSLITTIISVLILLLVQYIQIFNDLNYIGFILNIILYLLVIFLIFIAFIRNELKYLFSILNQLKSSK
ncbi:MAG: MOP flippase family protein [Bacteroidota bacterium]